MGSRRLLRRRSGRFRRGTIEDLGVSLDFCPNEDCRALNPYSVNNVSQDRRARCHRCDTLLAPPSAPSQRPEETTHDD